MCDPVHYLPTIRSGSFAHVGSRTTMQDEHIMINDLSQDLGSRCRCPNPSAFFAVFDGHGSPDAAAYIKEHVSKIFFDNDDFQRTIRADDILPEAIKYSIYKAFLSADLALYNDVSRSSGTTAITALILGRHLLVAHVGHCRAVLSQKGEAKDMSQDHKPIYTAERARVEQSGGYVHGKYLDGKISVSRSLGDWDIKHHQGSGSPLIAEPEIVSILLTEDDEFVIIACDGIWEALSSQQAVSRVRCGLRRHGDPEQCAKDLVMKAVRLHTYDNLTVIVVSFSTPRERLPREERKFGCFSLSAEFSR